MHYRKTLITMASSALLFGLGYGPAGEVFAENADAQSAVKPAIKAEVRLIAQSGEASAKAKAEQELKKFKNLIDLQQKALSEKFKPGEIRYVYINDKEYHASPSSTLFASNSYRITYKTYDEYAEKYAAGNTAMPLRLQQQPEGYNLWIAEIAPYLSEKEKAKISNQVIAEGKASGKKIYVKKLQEKRTAVHLIYNMTSEKNGKRGVLGIIAEPAGPNDKTVESEPVMAQSEKLEVGGQEVIYTPIDNMEYKSVAWMNPQTRVNYIIRETRGHLTKEAMLALAGQIIAHYS
ncbi:hypothetical protein J7E73_00490 [Paenibacillus albidus]|uniref:hypothetical protein n=1 Tax=Paenibacillus albidus TaxID=2041023 RepID=UPI001BE80337|nr:hypothetical protein [Paenibacillus albidus]MBT2287631.1 hypothetical protein [Paenibacillus albidus]